MSKAREARRVIPANPRIPDGPPALEARLNRLAEMGYNCSYPGEQRKDFLTNLVRALREDMAAYLEARVRGVISRNTRPAAYRIEKGKVVVVYMVRTHNDVVAPETMRRFHALSRLLDRAGWTVELLRVATTEEWASPTELR